MKNNRDDMGFDTGYSMGFVAARLTNYIGVPGMVILGLSVLFLMGYAFFS